VITASQICAEERVRFLDRTSYYTTCPQCSGQRKNHNRRKPCLGVEIGNRGVRFTCFHCGWFKPRFYDEGEWHAEGRRSQPSRVEPRARAVAGDRAQDTERAGGRDGDRQPGQERRVRVPRNGELLWRQTRIAKADGSKSFACHAPDGRTLKEAGIELSFWNEDEITDESELEIPRVITEGQFDAASFKAAGVPYVGSVPNGAVDRMGEGEIIPSEDKQFAYLWDGNQLRGGLAQAHTIILATDSDRAGRVLREELALRLGRGRCWYVTYPPGCKDANDVLQKFGPDKGCDLLNDIIADAKPVVASKLSKLSSIPVVKRESVTCGWTEVSRHLRIERPEMLVITGPPGDGKSQFAMALGANLAHQHQWPGAILQFEDDVERGREDLTRYWIGRNRTMPNGAPLDPRESTAEDRKAAAEWIDRYFRVIPPSEDLDDERCDLDWLKRTIAEAAIRHRCRWVLIDPWNEIEHMWGKGLTESQYLNDALRDIKKLARRYQLAIIIVAHPDKASCRLTDVEEWDLYSISGGQAWNNKADHGVVVLRPDKSDTTTFIRVSKSKRHATMGVPGIVRMHFKPLFGTYECVAK
jgi:twinkle protein